MKKTILIVLGLFCLGILALALFIYSQPDSFMVERSLTMTAPPSKIFPMVNDLKSWDSWSPWKDLDPSAKTTLSEPSGGEGATLAWNGNEKIGEGTLIIRKSIKDKRVELEQEFVRPQQGKAQFLMILTPDGEGTKVTMRMVGNKDFAGKAVCLVMDMDAMLGNSFEKGLSNIKAVVEKTE